MGNNKRTYREEGIEPITGETGTDCKKIKNWMNWTYSSDKVFNE